MRIFPFKLVTFTFVGTFYVEFECLSDKFVQIFAEFSPIYFILHSTENKIKAKLCVTKFQ